MSLIKRILGSLEARLSQPWFNPWRTLYFNFRTLPFSQAIHLPIYVYGGGKILYVKWSCLYRK